MSNNKKSNIIKKFYIDFSWDWDLVKTHKARKAVKKATSRYNRRVNKALVILDQINN